MTSFLPSILIAVIWTKSPRRAAGPNLIIASTHWPWSYWPVGRTSSGFFDLGIWTLAVPYSALRFRISSVRCAEVIFSDFAFAGSANVIPSTTGIRASQCRWDFAIRRTVRVPEHPSGRSLHR